MEGPVLLAASNLKNSSGEARQFDCEISWLPALSEQRAAISAEVRHCYGAHVKSVAPVSASPSVPGGATCNDEDSVDYSGDERSSTDTENPFSSSSRVDRLQLHALHRRRLYRQYASDLAHLSDMHYFYRLLMWCHDRHIFLHPALCMHRGRTQFRDHYFTVREPVAQYTPLLAIPEALVIGFKETTDENNNDMERNSLYDARREKEFNELNSGESSDTDICQFFFASLGMIVSDLITARSSPLTDPRHDFAELLGKVQALKNAPYFEDNVVFDSEETCLADVLLQMIRNYINGGPLVNKVPRSDLQWAVSVCLSHSTPLQIGTKKSIGIIPMVHLFPHGGLATNSYVVARTGREGSAEKLNGYFRHQHGLDFGTQGDGRWVFVVPERDLKAGEEVCLQAMAPVCDRDDEAEQMWRLSCGTTPKSYKSSRVVAQRQADVTATIVRRGEEKLAEAERRRAAALERDTPVEENSDLDEL